jgi:hypothetical protein
MNLRFTMFSLIPFFIFSHRLLDSFVILGYIVRFVFIRKNCCFREEE